MPVGATGMPHGPPRSVPSPYDGQITSLVRRTRATRWNAAPIGEFAPTRDLIPYALESS